MIADIGPSPVVHQHHHDVRFGSRGWLEARRCRRQDECAEKQATNGKDLMILDIVYRDPELASATRGAVMQFELCFLRRIKYAPDHES